MLSFLGDVKEILRISSTTVAYDKEIQGLIDAAKRDLIQAGVLAAKALETDPSISLAIKIYCKAHFGWDNPDAGRLEKAYANMKATLTLLSEYTGCTVTFTVTSGGTPVTGAKVTFDGESKVTGASGVVEFRGVKVENQVEYLVTADNYGAATAKVDVMSDMSVAVSLTASS